MRPSRGWVQALIVAATLAAPQARAADFSGTARLDGGTTQQDEPDRRTDSLNQSYWLRLYQPVTPLLSTRASFQATLFDFWPDEGAHVRRQILEPYLEGSYRYDAFTTRAVWSQRLRRSTDSDELDTQSLTGSASWNPGWGPRVSLTAREQSNGEDVSVFGRANRTRSGELTLLYRATRWSARYGLSVLRLDNTASDSRIQNLRHTVRATWADSFADVVRVATDVLVNRSDYEHRAAVGETVGDPLEAQGGLYAVDVTPEVGSLESEPSLVDGNYEAPAAGIDVGGSNTYRNLGIDLGFSRPVSRLEVWVDGVSKDPDLGWTVYTSADNLTWTPAPPSTRGPDFEPTLLVYTITLPEGVSARYLKVVNTAPNDFPDVLVTEVRAFVDVSRTNMVNRSGTDLRGSAQVTLTPWEWLDASFTVAGSDLTSEAQTLLVRDVRQISYDGGVSVRPHETVTMRVSGSASELERGVPDALTRGSRRALAAVVWTPLGTANVDLSAQRREELDRSALIRRSDSMRLRAVTALLPTLSLVSDGSYDVISDPSTGADDPSLGFDMKVWTWREAVTMRPTESISVDAGGYLSWLDADSALVVDSRQGGNARVSWRILPSVTASGGWEVSRDDRQMSVSQRYSLGWNPGPRLTTSAAYSRQSATSGPVTQASGASLTYVLTRRASAFANVSQSSQSGGGVTGSGVVSARGGFQMVF